MDRRILALIDDYPQWRGDVYRLVALVLAKADEIRQEEIDTEPVEDGAAS